MKQKQFGFSKDERLCDKRSSDALFQSRASLFAYPFKCLYNTTDTDTLRIIVSVGKKYHKRAVKRNVVRRRSREAFRLNKYLFYQNKIDEGVDQNIVNTVKGCDICLIYIANKEENYSTIENAIQKLITSLKKVC